jgi:anti-sigma B factor antagonist
MAPQFSMVDARDADGALRLTLLGELDLTVADQLEARLQELRTFEPCVRLDLSELSFIDSSGIRIVIRARLDADRDGWALNVDPHVSEIVRRPLELLGLDEVLWSKTPD